MTFNGGTYNPTALFITHTPNPIYTPKRSQTIKNKIKNKRK